MTNTRRRIEKLEKSRATLQEVYAEITRQALSWLSLNEVELLITAYAGDRSGRPLTRPELAARQAYALAVQRNRTGGRVCPEVQRKPEIRHAIFIAFAERMRLDELELARDGSQVIAQGGTLTERQSAAIEACNSEMKRLRNLAGLDSSASRRR